LQCPNLNAYSDAQDGNVEKNSFFPPQHSTTRPLNRYSPSNRRLSNRAGEGGGGYMYHMPDLNREQFHIEIFEMSCAAAQRLAGIHERLARLEHVIELEQTRVELEDLRLETEVLCTRA